MFKNLFVCFLKIKSEKSDQNKSAAASNASALDRNSLCISTKSGLQLVFFTHGFVALMFLSLPEDYCFLRLVH